MRATMHKLLLALFVGVAATLSVSGAVTLELKNGARLVGTITKEENGKVYFHADMVGDVVIEAASIAKRTEEIVAPIATPEADIAPSAPVVPALGTAMAAATKLTEDEGTSGAAPGSGAPEGEPEAAVATASGAGAQAKKPVWKRAISLSGSYNSATFEQGKLEGIPASSPIQTGAQAGLQGQQSTLQITGMLLRLTPMTVFSLTGSYGYANYQPAGTVMNNRSAEMTYEYLFSPVDFWFARSTYKEDQIAYIDHYFEEIIGYGRKLVDTKSTKLNLVPGVSFVNEQEGTRFDNEWIASVGFLENLEYTFNSHVALEERFKYRIGVTDRDVWDINSYLGLSFPIIDHLSFDVGATYNYDNTLGPLPARIANSFEKSGFPVSIISALHPEKKDQLLLTSGLQLHW